MLKIALKTPYYSLWKPLWLVSKCFFSYLDERGAERCLGRAQNNLGRGYFWRPSASPGCCCQNSQEIWCHASPSPLLQPNPKGQVVLNQKPSLLPKDEREAPNQYAKILHLEGTKQNNIKAKTLASYSQRELHKVMTEVNNIYFYIIILSSFLYLFLSMYLVKSFVHPNFTISQINFTIHSFRNNHNVT